MRRLAAITMYFIAGVGCTGKSIADKLPLSPTTHSTAISILTIRGDDGAIIATGELMLPKSLPGEGGQFDGVWSLKTSASKFPADATSPGIYLAEIYHGLADIDLNPGTSDYNVMLTGKAADGGLRGDCWLARYQGGNTFGSFTIEPANSHAH